MKHKNLLLNLSLAAILSILTIALPVNKTIASTRNISNIPNLAPLNDAWSTPLTGRIAYAGGGEESDNIYIMNADGANQTRLTPNPYADEDPSFSPDGTKIAYSATLGPDDSDIFIMSADGSNKINVTNKPSFNGEPAWSPDGSKIAFVSYRDGNDEIYVMNTDGSNAIRLTNNTSIEGYPTWSPNGAKIAFVSDRDIDVNYGFPPSNINPNEIYTMNSDGTNVVRLTNNIYFDYYPAWSPDGTKIAFTSARDGGSSGIYVMNADGSNQSRLTDGYCSAWSPDGTKLRLWASLKIFTS
jgi:Tol biopolymer transport system component